MLHGSAYTRHDQGSFRAGVVKLLYLALWQIFVILYISKALLLGLERLQLDN